MQPMCDKSIVSISGMARMVGLSRARFYQLVGTTFPWPLYDIATRRPFYGEKPSVSASTFGGGTVAWTVSPSCSTQGGYNPLRCRRKAHTQEGPERQPRPSLKV